MISQHKQTKQKARQATSFCFVLLCFVLFRMGVVSDVILLFPGEGMLIHLVVRVDEVHLQSLLDVVAELVVILLAESLQSHIPYCLFMEYPVHN